MTKPTSTTAKLIAELQRETATWVEPSPFDLGLEHSVPFVAVWPRSGMTVSGRAYELVTLVPRTSAKGSSSSRTRTSSQKSDPQPDSLFDLDDETEATQPEQVDAMLPTPQANLADNGGSQPPEKRRAGGHSVSLEDAIEHDAIMLPTPRVSIANGPGKHGDGGADLQTAIAELPTPSVSNTNGNHTNNRGELLLPGVAEGMELFPSPTVALADGGQTSRSGDRKGEALLGGIAEQLMPTPTTEPNTGNGHARDLGSEVRDLFPTPVVSDADSARNSTAVRSVPNPGHEGDTLLDAVDALLPTPAAVQLNDSESAEQWQARHDMHASKPEGATRAGLPLPIAVQVMGESTDDLTSDGEHVRWGKYRAAILRAQAVSQRLAPSPTKADGKGGKRRLAARFVEWMMLLPYGWVTDVPGLSRRDMLKMLGNGVVPAQAALATAILLDRVRAALVDRAA